MQLRGRYFYERVGVDLGLLGESGEFSLSEGPSGRFEGARDFREFAAQLHAEHVKTKGPITLVRSVLRAAHANGYLDELPVCPPGLVSTSRKVPGAASSEEVEVMLRASGWLGVAIALGAMAGMRMGEVRALEVRNIEFDQGCIIIRRALSEDESLTPKSGAERRVPLAATLEQRLREAVKDKLPRARVVLDDAGQTPRRQAVLHLLKKYLGHAGLKERSFHSLRHFFISELMRVGASAEAVRVLAGHSKLEMNQKYANAVPADLRAAIDRLGK